MQWNTTRESLAVSVSCKILAIKRINYPNLKTLCHDCLLKSFKIMIIVVGLSSTRETKQTSKKELKVILNNKRLKYDKSLQSQTFSTENHLHKWLKFAVSIYLYCFQFRREQFCNNAIYLFIFNDGVFQCETLKQELVNTMIRHTTLNRGDTFHYMLSHGKYCSQLTVMLAENCWRPFHQTKDTIIK